MMILDLSTRKRKHPESPNYSNYPTPERSPEREDSPTMYHYTYPNSLSQLLEPSNSSQFFTTSSAKPVTSENFRNEPLYFTCELDMENNGLIETHSTTSYTQTSCELPASTDGTDVITRRNQSSENKDTSFSSELKTRSFTSLPKYPLHLSSASYHKQCKDEVPLGHKNVTNENLKTSQHQSLKYEDTSCLENDEKSNEATERSIDVRRAHCSAVCSENVNQSNSSTSLLPKLKTHCSLECSKNFKLSNSSSSPSSKLKSRPITPLHLSSGLNANKEKMLPIDSATLYKQFRDEIHYQVEKKHDISNISRNQIKNEDEASSKFSMEYSKNCNLSEISISSLQKLKTRPFKAFSKDLLSGLVMNNEEVLPNVTTTSYTQFRDRVLSQVHANHNVSNTNMRRNQLKSSDNEDPSYLEKRKKNNNAAKKSRDARKAKEDEIAIRCAFLEQENMELRNRLNILDSYVHQLGNCLRYS